MHMNSIYSMRRDVISALADPLRYEVTGLDGKDHLKDTARLPHCLRLEAEDLHYNAHGSARQIVQLMLAHDFGLEPSLKAFNGLDKKKTDLLGSDVYNLSGVDLEIGKPGSMKQDFEAGAYEKPLYDSAQFKGASASVTQNFIVRNNNEGGLDIFLNATQKNRLLAQASVLKCALNETAEAEKVSMQGRTLLNSLQDGRATLSYDEKRWLYNTARYDASEAFLPIVRHIFHDRLGVRRHQFMALSADKHTYILTLRGDCLSGAQNRLSSATPYASLVRRGISQADHVQMRLLHELFSDIAAMGFDLKDFTLGTPSQALKNAFEALLMESEAYEVLATLKTMQGDDTPNPL